MAKRDSLRYIGIRCDTKQYLLARRLRNTEPDTACTIVARINETLITSMTYLKLLLLPNIRSYAQGKIHLHS